MSFGRIKEVDFEQVLSVLRIPHMHRLVVIGCIGIEVLVPKDVCDLGLVVLCIGRKD